VESERVIYQQLLIPLERDLSKDFSKVSTPSPTDSREIVLMSLFTETSLEEIRDVVRRKLQLPPNSTVKLKQLRGLKQAIDLDDGKVGF
jgi:hypothetical protein